MLDSIQRALREDPTWVVSHPSKRAHRSPDLQPKSFRDVLWKAGFVCIALSRSQCHAREDVGSRGCAGKGSAIQSRHTKIATM
eukprot:1161687-Pelagomonas_calceolata.AAC.11